MILTSGSSFPLGAAVNCPLEMFLAHQLKVYQVYRYVIVKSICCIRSPHLPEGGGGRGKWDGGMGLTPLFFFVFAVISL